MKKRKQGGELVEKQDELRIPEDGLPVWLEFVEGSVGWQTPGPPGWENYPIFHTDKQKAEASIADDLIDQLEQVKRGERELEEVWIPYLEEATMYPDGSLDFEGGTAWSVEEIRRMEAER